MSEEKRKLGRPTTGDGPKSINMSIRLSVQERDALKKKAEEKHTTVSRLIIDTVLNSK